MPIFAILVSSAKADNYQKLASQVAQSGTVDIVVSGGWNAVTGDIDPRDLHRAITGDIDLPGLQQKFTRQMQAGGAIAEPLYTFKYLPFSVLRVDRQGLENVRNFSSKVAIWENLEIKSQLTESTEMIGAPIQWQMNGTGTGQVVAVIDSGVDASHPMLRNRVVFEACVILLGCRNGKSIDIGPNASLTKTNHGTHVAGIIAGNGNGIYGVAPEAFVASFKVLDENGSGRALDVLVALDMIYQLKTQKQLNINVVNMSLGGGYFPDPCDEHPFEAAAAMLQQEGVSIVAASGNEGYADALGAPACATSIISVGAVDKTWNIAEFSNASEHLNLLAPGVGIKSSSVSNDGQHVLEKLDGTSMATPHVAGAMAVMHQMFPDKSSNELFEMLKGEKILDPRNGLSFPMLSLPQKIDNEPVSSPEPEPVPAPLPEDNGGTIAITG